jgi:hypothetical protein
MAGMVRVSKLRVWGVAGWAFRGVVRSALKHIPDSSSSLRKAVDDSIKGFNYIRLDEGFTQDEVRVFLSALRTAYRDAELAGPSSFGDPSYFPSYMEGFTKLIRLIEEELASNHPGGSGGPVVNTRE